MPNETNQLNDSLPIEILGFKEFVVRIMGGFTLVLLILFLWKYSYVTQLNSQGITVKGAVVGIDKKLDTLSLLSRHEHSKRYNCYPIVNFVTKDGSPMTVKVSRSDCFQLIDQKVEIIYFPDSPKQAEIKDSLLFFWPWVYLITAVFCFIIAVFFAWFGRKSI